MASLSCSEVTGQNCSYHAMESQGEAVEADVLNHIMSAHAQWYGQLSEQERTGIQHRMSLAASQSVGLAG